MTHFLIVTCDLLSLRLLQLSLWFDFISFVLVTLYVTKQTTTYLDVCYPPLSQNISKKRRQSTYANSKSVCLVTL